jgi:hypothetical protein
MWQMWPPREFQPSRRAVLATLGNVGIAGVLGQAWLARMLQAGPTTTAKRCILLWMSGGASQTDTFDPKPGHANGGPTKTIDTAVPGIVFSEHLPLLARQAGRLAVIRSMTSAEGDHQRGTQQMLTGYRPNGPLQYPVMGSVVSKYLGNSEQDLPSFVSLSGPRFGQVGPGFLGPKYAPLTVSGFSDDPNARANLTIDGLLPPPGVSSESVSARAELSRVLQAEFRQKYAGTAVESFQENSQRATRMILTEAQRAFHLEDEPPALREAYGRGRFGQSCLLARRLIERGVSFVEVAHTGVAPAGLGWDTHTDHFTQNAALCQTLDAGWSTLLQDLHERGLLQDTLVVWMGEFGRTPQINPNQGRDHFPQAWATVLAGGGIAGGTVVGRTSDDGQMIVDRPVSVPEFMASLFHALGMDLQTEHLTPEGRPVALVENKAQPVQALFGG